MPYRPSDAEWSQYIWKIIQKLFCRLDFTKSWFDVSFSSKGPSGRRVKPSPPAPPYYSLSIYIRSKYALRVTRVDRKMIPDVSRSFWYLQISILENFIKIWIFMKVRFEYTKMTGRHQRSFFLSTLAWKSSDSSYNTVNFWFFQIYVDILIILYSISLIEDWC